MVKDNFPIRLKEARLMMGFSMDKLVERAGGAITKQSISRYERGIMHPKHKAQASLAKALNISMDYFNGTSLKIDLPMLRTTSGNQLTEEDLVALEAKLSFWVEQYLDKEKKAGISTSFTNQFRRLQFQNWKTSYAWQTFFGRNGTVVTAPCHVYCDCWSEKASKF